LIRPDGLPGAPLASLLAVAAQVVEHVAYQPLHTWIVTGALTADGAATC
jgi:hypothetical protein